jgi:uncharacterized protein YgbK (DUF1537 family)
VSTVTPSELYLQLATERDQEARATIVSGALQGVTVQFVAELLSHTLFLALDVSNALLDAVNREAPDLTQAITEAWESSLERVEDDHVEQAFRRMTDDF